jgi:transcriptional regulator with XRE-family HTH domain
MNRDLAVLFRKQLASLREAEGLTQVKLSEMIGAGPQYVGHVETGRIKTPPWDRLKKLAKALNVSVSDLFFFVSFRQACVTTANSPCYFR